MSPARGTIGPRVPPKGHVGSGRTRRESRLFSQLKVLPPTCGYCASLCAACDQIGPSSGYDVQPSLKKARTIWHLESGDDSPNLGVAVVNKTGTDCLSHSQQAPVQQGEQEVRAILGRRSARQDLEGPFGRQQSAPRPIVPLRRCAYAGRRLFYLSIYISIYLSIYHL